MSFNLVLIVIAAALPIALFADRMSQWGLKSLLSEDAEYQRMKASMQQAAAEAEESPAAAPASAQAA